MAQPHTRQRRMGANAPALPSPADALAAEIAGLRPMNLDELRDRWLKLWGRAAPRALKSDLLARGIAQHRQVLAGGDVSRETARLLARLAGPEDPSAVLAGEPQRRIKLGTVLVREHAGTLHHVRVLPDGYARNGTTYKSLSQAARAITGTRWNGWAFFGPQPRRSKQAKAEAGSWSSPGQVRAGQPQPPRSGDRSKRDLGAAAAPSQGVLL